MDLMFKCLFNVAFETEKKSQFFYLEVFLSILYANTESFFKASNRYVWLEFSVVTKSSHELRTKHNMREFKKF